MRRKSCFLTQKNLNQQQHIKPSFFLDMVTSHFQYIFVSCLDLAHLRLYSSSPPAQQTADPQVVGRKNNRFTIACEATRPKQMYTIIPKNPISVNIFRHAARMRLFWETGLISVKDALNGDDASIAAPLMDNSETSEGSRNIV